MLFGTPVYVIFSIADVGSFTAAIAAVRDDIWNVEIEAIS